MQAKSVESSRPEMHAIVQTAVVAPCAIGFVTSFPSHTFVLCSSRDVIGGAETAGWSPTVWCSSRDRQETQEPVDLSLHREEQSSASTAIHQHSSSHGKAV